MKYFLTLFFLTTSLVFGQTITGTRLQLGATGVLFTQSNGTLTLTGSGNGTDENLTFNLNTANALVLSSSTGVATIDAGGFAITTTGVITGVGTGLTGTAAGLTAGTVTTIPNLTGHVTSTGNATVLGAFTKAQLNTAISDDDVVTLAGTQTITGDKTFSGTMTIGSVAAGAVTATIFEPLVDDGTAIGNATTKRWSDLFLAEGGVIDWDNGDVTVTQTGNNLTVAGGDLTATLNSAAVGATAAAADNDTSVATTAFVQGEITHEITFTVDGAGSALATGVQMPVKVPHGGVIIGYTMMCSPSGSITFNVFRAADGAGLPTVSIIDNAGGGGGSGTLPAVAAGVEGKSTTLTNWGSTTITAFDNLALNLTTVDGTVTKCSFVLYYQ